MLHIGIGLSLNFCLGKFVSLRKNYGKRNAVFSKPLYELKVDFLGVVAQVYEQKQTSQLLPAENIVGNDAFQLFLRLFAPFSISVAGKIHKVPTVVDQKMIDQKSLARSCGSLGQSFSSGKHVDERRFAHITAPDKGILRTLFLWTLVQTKTADRKFC